MGAQTTGPRVRFDSFELDVVAGDLYHGGERVRLQEQPRQVLVALLERPGVVITREELRERLWKTDTFVDFEHGLNTAIKKVRQALGDSADESRFVETLAKRGYRFIAPVNPPQPPAPTTSLATPTADPRELPLGNRWFLVLFLAAVVAGALWLARLPQESTTPAGGATSTARLAVLPLKVLKSASAAQDSAYLGIGIADAITTRLANVRQIALLPTAAVLPYAERAADPARVAAALSVEHVIVGTIQEADDTYRVSVQLVRANGVAIWGRSYDVPRAGLLRLQDTVAEQVVEALRVQLSAPERARLTATLTDNPAAYDLYLRGRALLANYTDANIRESIGRFEQALELDPKYAQARSALAIACAWFSVRYAYESEAVAWGRRAEEEARRALAQDPLLGEAHLAIGNAAGTQHRGFDFATLLEETATALALDPSLDLAHVARMRAFYHLGQFEEAHQEELLARALNPSPGIETERLEVAIDLFAGRFAAAATHAEALLQRTDAPAVRQYLGLARFYQGDAAGARAMLASAKRGDQPDVRAQASLASIEAATGARREARARLAVVERGSYMDHHVAYSLGAAYAQLGDADASIKWLERAADTGFPCYPWFERDMLLEPVRGDVRFRALIDRLRATLRPRA